HQQRPGAALRVLSPPRATKHRPQPRLLRRRLARVGPSHGGDGDPGEDGGRPRVGTDHPRVMAAPSATTRGAAPRPNPGTPLPTATGTLSPLPGAPAPKQVDFAGLEKKGSPETRRRGCRARGHSPGRAESLF